MTPAQTGLLALIPTAYIAGSIPFGLIVGLSKGVDPRKAGSGNIGATNVGRLLGGKFFAIVFILDLLKEHRCPHGCCRGAAALFRRQRRRERHVAVGRLCLDLRAYVQRVPPLQGRKGRRHQHRRDRRGLPLLHAGSTSVCRVAHLGHCFQTLRDTSASPRC